MGNLLLQDEGVGVHLIQALRQLPPEGKDVLTIIDGGTCPDAFDLVPQGIHKLIIVDAVRGGSEPGTIYRFTPEDVAFATGAITSLHQLGLAEGLRMMESSALQPKEVVIIGVEPGAIGWGLELSPELQRSLPQIVQVVQREIARSAV